MGFSVENIKDIPKAPEVGGYREIRPEGGADFQTSRSFWDKVFGAETSADTSSSVEANKGEGPQKGEEKIEIPPVRTEGIPEGARSMEPIGAKELPGYENHLPEILNAAEKDTPANGENG